MRKIRNSMTSPQQPDDTVPLPQDVFVELYLALRKCSCQQTRQVKMHVDTAMARLPFTVRARLMQAVAAAIKP